MDPAQLDVFKTVKEITGETLNLTAFKPETLNTFRVTISLCHRRIFVDSKLAREHELTQCLWEPGDHSRENQAVCAS